jgi:hypothetical protein
LILGAAPNQVYAAIKRHDIKLFATALDLSVPPLSGDNQAQVAERQKDCCSNQKKASGN